MKPFFFFDYDGTVFSHSAWSVPESAIAALEDLHRSGYRVCLASGRSLSGSMETESFHGRFVPDATVGCNGAIIRIGGKLIWEKYFDRDLRLRIMDFCDARGYCLAADADGVWAVSNPERCNEIVGDVTKLLQPAQIGDFSIFYDRDNIAGFFMMDTDEAINDVKAHFPEIKTLSMGPGRGADIVPKENGKASGAQRVLDYYGASWDEVVAIGDSMNDVELIKKARLGISMGNAMREVRDAADYVTGHIDENGFADAVAYALAWAKQL